MIIPELTDLNRNVVAVTPREFTFGSGCAVCGSNTSKLTPIRFRNVLIVGVAGGVEAITLEVPLCDEHIYKQQHAESRIAYILAAFFFSGLILVSVPFYLMRDRVPSSSKIEIVAGAMLVTGVLLILGSMIAMLTIKAHLPINLTPRTHGKFGTGEYGAFVFSFPDSTSAKRFFDANNAQS